MYDLKKRNLTYNEIIEMFLAMVRKTLTFEKLHLNKRSKKYACVYPLLEEAKEKLYFYYITHLSKKLKSKNNPLLREFLNSMRL